MDILLTGPLRVIITLGGVGIVEYLVRMGEEGADLEKYLVSQKLVRSETLSRLPDLRCLGGSAEYGLVVWIGVIPYIRRYRTGADPLRDQCHHGASRMWDRKDWRWMVSIPLVGRTSGRSSSLVTLLKRLGPRDSHSQECRRLKAADLYGR